jgi:thioredoxin-dependent adenylylsulfate APS reductase
MSEHSYKEYGYEGNGEAEDILRWALDLYHPRIAIACSFQHTVLIDMAVKINPEVRVFSIDTGRLPEESYECARDIERHFGIKLEWFVPQTESVEKMLHEEGPLSFKESMDSRRRCCGIRKVEPLKRALSPLDAWITGVRREQSSSRTDTRKIEIDQTHGGMLKINPLADWSYDDVRNYVKDNKLPYNTLFEKGYRSIGCSCCTRPVKSNEDSRAGRWWWEESEHKECGLHVRNWNI